MADNEELRNNLQGFREAFGEYPECYTIIGGTACFLLLEDAGMEFRATSDIDMILVLEEGREAFGKAFWDYIVAGGYTCGWKDSEPHYYRFTKPKPGYPGQIELFSRRADFTPDRRIIPVHIAEDVSSLSAIALDENFYGFMKEGRTVVGGISVLSASHMIPFKMYAWLNNRDLRVSGKAVNTDDIKKHKNDVFRLLPLLNPDERIRVSGSVGAAVGRFLHEIKAEAVNTDALGLGLEKDSAVRLLESIYMVSGA